MLVTERWVPGTSSRFLICGVLCETSSSIPNNPWPGKTPSLPPKAGLVFRLKFGASRPARVPLPRTFRRGSAKFAPSCAATYHSARIGEGEHNRSTKPNNPALNLLHTNLVHTMVLTPWARPIWILSGNLRGRLDNFGVSERGMSNASRTERYSLGCWDVERVISISCYGSLRAEEL
ncbi:hypothetical protein NSND_61222 [Nitrospira sp. ND1]|nr:hypothetical protein NSND_61222 [Nitrospira sp. ND1]